MNFLNEKYLIAFHASLEVDLSTTRTQKHRCTDVWNHKTNSISGILPAIPTLYLEDCQQKVEENDGILQASRESLTNTMAREVVHNLQEHLPVGRLLQLKCQVRSRI